MANVADTISRGIPIVTDLHFWKEDSAWAANRSYLEQNDALLIEGVNVFDVAGTLSYSTPQFHLDLSDIGLVVVGGFYPHHLMSAVVQALAHQLIFSDVLMLYASRDAPPDFQDRNVVHIQGWTADAENGYVIRAGRQGVGDHSRCHSPEAMCRGVQSDAALVKVSAFTRSPSNVRFVGAQISPASTVQTILDSGRHVLFCGEGDASLARSCLQKPPQPIVHFFPTPYRYFPNDDTIETYATLLQRAADECWHLEYAAKQWAWAWPTTMQMRSQHRFCGCLHGSGPSRDGASIVGLPT